MLKLIFSICCVVFLGGRAFCGAEELFGEDQRAFIVQRLSNISEDLEISYQGVKYFSKEFRDSNSHVNPAILTVITDEVDFGCEKFSRAFHMIDDLIGKEMKKEPLKRHPLRIKILKTKSKIVEMFREKGPRSLQELYSIAPQVGFKEGDIPLFYRTIIAYKENNVALLDEALSEIFQSMSPHSTSSLIAASSSEPVAEKKAKPKSRAAKKRAKKKADKGSAAQSVLKENEEEGELPDEDAVEEEKPSFSSSWGPKERMDAEEGARAGHSITKDSKVFVPSADEKEQKEEEEMHVPLSLKMASTSPSVPTVKKETLREESSDFLLKEMFAAIWRTDCSVKAKNFVKFWEHFGFVNTQRAALGNGFFVLQHPNGYKLKTSHAPHSQDEAVFKMALSFAKHLLGSAGIKDAHDVVWQTKLSVFLSQPCEGMRR